MVSILKDDIQAARNKKYGFADHTLVIKDKSTKDGWIVIIKVLSMSYFTPKGKARLCPKWSYAVYTQDGWVATYSAKADAIKKYKHIVLLLAS
jgi:hypothetical protein